jgi:hypothetical protein
MKEMMMSMPIEMNCRGLRKEAFFSGGSSASGSERPTFARHIEALINDSPKTQSQISLEMGYEKPNMITMIKKGTTRVAFVKVPALADALGVDKAALLRLWFTDYEPEMLQILEDNPGVLSHQE